LKEEAFTRTLENSLSKDLRIGWTRLRNLEKATGAVIKAF
jgi:hypothetical protein